MSEATNTLTVIRRMICRELKMPFFRRYAAGFLLADSGTAADTIKDSSLTQADKFWNGSWFYGVATQEVSIIRAFESANNSFKLEIPTAIALSAGDQYEIHSIWNATEIRQAINRAIGDGGRIWQDTVTDETLIVQEDKLSYSLSGLSTRPWIVAKVYVESNPTVKRGTLASATATGFTVENSTILTDLTTASNWRISIYDGTGKGQLRTITSVSGAVGVVPIWTTTPDSTSKYAIWDTTEDVDAWPKLDTYRVDSPEYPSVLYLSSGNSLPSYLGLRFRIEYMAVPLELSLETDTTIIPMGYILPKAISYLYGQSTLDINVDRDTTLAEADRYKKQADEFLAMNLPHKPDIALKYSDYPSSFTSDNPLDWSR